MSRPAQRGRRQNASLRKGITSAASPPPPPPHSTSAAPVLAESTAGIPRRDSSGGAESSLSHRTRYTPPPAEDFGTDLPSLTDTADSSRPPPSQAAAPTPFKRNTGHTSQSTGGDKSYQQQQRPGHQHTSKNDSDSLRTTQHNATSSVQQCNARTVFTALNKTSPSAMRTNRAGDSAYPSAGGGGIGSGNTAASGDVASSSPASGSSRFTPSPHTVGTVQYSSGLPGRPPYPTSSADAVPQQSDALAPAAPPYPAPQGSAYIAQASLTPFPPQAHQHLHQQSHQQHPGYSGHIAQHSPYAAFHQHLPASPSSAQQQYSQAMGGDATQQSHANYNVALRSMSVSGDATAGAASHAPVRAVSPVGSQQEATAEPYLYPYMTGSDPAAGHHPYYPAGPLGPAFAPGQYPASNVYALQYYPPYSQPAYYGARPPGWMHSLSATQQQGWQRPPYYPTYTTNGLTAPQQAYQQRFLMPQSMHGRPRAPAQSPHLSNQRGVGGPTRTSSAIHVHSAQRSSSSSLATTAAESTRQSRASRTASSGGTGGGAQQALQGQGPRSEHVLWCGNVPADATLDELRAFFSRLPPVSSSQESHLEVSSRGDAQDTTAVADLDATAGVANDQSHGVMSIFVIARSNCAFVNYATPRHLQRALEFFQGQTLRPHDPRCPKLVCRVRKKDDEAQAGVAGQRGRGIHVAWLKEQERIAKEDRQTMSADEAVEDLHDKHLQLDQQQQRYDELPSSDRIVANANLRNAEDESVRPTSLPAPVIVRDTATPTPQKSTGGMLSPSLPRPSMDSSSGSGSVSYASTNSSLFRHPAFHERFFILKSSHVKDLDKSVETGMWATQPHNEAVLDQAYRNSENVYLIFSANQSGGFYGYARMNGTIHPTPERTGTARPFSIPEHDESAANDVVGEPAQILDGALPTAPPVASPLPMSSDDESPGLAESSGASAPTPDLYSNKNGQGLVHSSNTLKPQSGPSHSSAKSTDAKCAADATEDETSSDQMITVSPLSFDDIDPLKSPHHASTMGVSINSAFSEPLQTSGKKAQGAASSSETPSISPWESASYPADNTRSQSQLAIRALIHNLRLDAKESVHRAKQLEAVEAEMKAQEAAGDVSSNGSSNGGGQAGEQSSDALEKASIVIKPQPLASSAETWGKPFKVEWIKVRPLSFSQVRALRNPWRDNRQVKVSRDGTELEPHVGRRLLEFWGSPSDSFARRQSGDAQSNLSSTADDDNDDEEDDAA